LRSAEGAGRGHVNGKERRIREDSFWKIIREDSFCKNIPQTVTVVLDVVLDGSKHFSEQ